MTAQRVLAAAERVVQKRSGIVHPVQGGFTLCGRWAGRRGSFRPTLAEPTCRRCLLRGYGDTHG